MRRLATLALLFAVLPLGAAAQQADSAASTDWSPRVTPAFGLHYGTPSRLSVAAGLVVDLNRRSLDGILVSVEPGQSGIEYAVGYLRMIGRFGSGLSVRTALLRTYSDPWEANPNTTYVGGELHFMVALGVGGRVGLFKRSTGEPGLHDTMGTIGFALGL